MDTQSTADTDFTFTDQYPKMTFYLLLLGYFVVAGMELLNFLLLIVSKIKALLLLKISIASVLGGLFFLLPGMNYTEMYSDSS